MAIIGISGKMQSGKNTVASIIQYLTELDTNGDNTTFDDFKEYLYFDAPTWQQKSFAHKVKEIVSILTGIPIKDLEKREVKDRVLGEEWLVWKEESTFDSKFKLLHLEEPLTFGNCKKVQYTVRQLLQEIGTDAMRNVIHPNVWINALFTDYVGYSNNGHGRVGKEIPDGATYTDMGGVEHVVTYPKWIITDVRFPNDLKAIKDRGGIVIRINRIQSYMENKANAMREGNYEIHPSETALDNATFDYTIDNNGTIDELISKVKEILIKEKLI